MVITDQYRASIRLVTRGCACSASNRYIATAAISTMEPTKMDRV